MRKFYYYPILQIGKLLHKDVQLAHGYPVSKWHRGFEPRCKSRVCDDTFLREMQTQVDQNQKPITLLS